MIYRVRQTTAYAYHDPVTSSRHTLRIVPGKQPGQTLLDWSLTIVPEPVERRETHDFFGNQMISIAFEAPHDGLKIETDMRIEVQRADPQIPGLTPPWEDVHEAVCASMDPGPRSPAHFLHPSRLVPLIPAIGDYGAESFVPARPILEGVLDLSRRIHADFAYTPGATDATTPVAEAFTIRKGVCQDFAHVMICALRSIGLPAAYVSGYIRTEPPPGQERLQGADATHAWIAAWCGPEAGWIDVDPTNDCVAGQDHVVLARGRDYADVAPVEGVIVATGSHDLEVAVDVIPETGH